VAVINLGAFLQVGPLLLVLVVVSRPLGVYVYGVMEPTRTGSGQAVGRLERLFYRICQVDVQVDMGWSHYATSLLVFNVAGAALLYGLQRLQGMLPLNPGGLAAVAPATALNTVVSFATNTSWQSYSGETTLSYATQMIGIAAQSFLSAATGIAVLMVGVTGFEPATPTSRT